MHSPASEQSVLKVGDGHAAAIDELLQRFGVTVAEVRVDRDIPGSYWGNPEAGIVGLTVYLRDDTPVHSALHEAGHLICMSAHRRATLHGDAGGSDLEEAAVCFLQILLADYLPNVGRARLMRDMDAWGYSFRLGSTERWLSDDAADARAWLEGNGLIDARGVPRWCLRD